MFFQSKPKIEIKNILVSRTDKKIGDLIISIPSLYMLKKMYPNANLIVLVSKYNYHIIKHLNYIDKIIQIDRLNPNELLQQIENCHADVFIALCNKKYNEIAYLVKQSKAKIRIGPIPKIRKVAAFFLFNKGIIQNKSKSIKHEMEYNLDLVKKLNLELYDSNFELNCKLVIDEESKKLASVFFEQNSISGQTLSINPFSPLAAAKNIRDEQYVSLIKKIKDKIPSINIILLCHDNDKQRALDLIEASKEEIYLFSNTGSILQLGAIIEKTDVFFGSSTGPTHMAGFLNKKIVSIYSRTKEQAPTRWGIQGYKSIKYIFPDKNLMDENDNTPYFNGYNEDTELEIVEALERILEIDKSNL